MREIKFRAWDTFHKLITPIDWVSGTGKNDERFILMQYTGFTDHYGKEIYEGDIVNSLNGQIEKAVIYFSQGAFWYKEWDGFWNEFFNRELVYSDQDNIRNHGILHWPANRIALQVIGNIYENHELTFIEKLNNSKGISRSDDFSDEPAPNS